jgi:single-strand DNA-binding protein
MNRVELIGRITRDPELRYTGSNIATTRFTLAVNRPFQGQNGEQGTDFINIVVWRKQAENVKKYCSKGSLVAVEGRIQTGSYEKDGQRVYTTDVVADSVQFLESKAQSENRMSSDSNDFSQVTPQDFVNQEVKESDMSDEVFANFGDSVEISDDDIAF